MGAWKKLDLRRRDSTPPDGVLVALRLKRRRRPYDIHYNIGVVESIGTRKTEKFFRGSNGVGYLSYAQRAFSVCWAVVPPLDGDAERASDIHSREKTVNTEL